MSYKKLTFLIFISLIIGITIGFFVAPLFPKNQSLESDYIIVREGGYNFINPLLSCNVSENKQFDEFKPITDKFQTYVNQQISNGNAKDVSIYFRGLNTGRWSGVNVGDKYSPASLLKVPLMIAYLKKADLDPQILSESITYKQTSDQNSTETFNPEKFIQDGKTYTIADLIQYMIAYSDNNAAKYLQDHIDQNSLLDVYSDLGIPISSTSAEETMTPKIYSYLFRILYNATYLSKPSSQYALSLLSATDFPEGIKAGLPAGVPSSQKFGERTIVSKNLDGTDTVAFRELHDCGIVYYPKNPYLLCVMTKGQDFTKLSQIIADISKITYQETASGILQ